MQNAGDASPPALPVERGIVIFFFGVVLPVITILVELVLRMCDGAFFDPFPTFGHILAVATVPAANLFTLRAVREQDGRRLDAVIFAQALALGVSGVYALTFLPITPFALIAIIFLGLGLLPLTPLLSFLASLRGLWALRRLRKALGLPPRRTILAGVVAGVAVLVALQVPTAGTRVLMAMAASEKPALRRTGLEGLRRFGVRELMLRACYHRASGATDLLSAMVNAVAPVPPDEVREIYFRVTGRPFDTEPRPRMGRSIAREETEWDVGQAGAEVGVVPLRGLSLASSRIDGSIDGRAALAYLEWTFELRNEALLPREARAEVALPPGGVVSRVTLWIDGEEKEAAFASREATRRAYQRVVSARRDPILVTTSGPDRILVQCFPVPARGGVMKARIGITAPLYFPSREAGTLGLPHFTQRNFDVPARVTHAVWMASKDTFTPPAAPLARLMAAGGEEVRGHLAEPSRPGPIASVTVQRPADAAVAWTVDRSDGRPVIIRQTLRAEPIPAPPLLVVVIDGSGAMKRVAAQVEEGLRALPKGTVVIVAGDEPHPLPAGPLRLGEVEFAGGTDSLPALLLAWDRAVVVPGSVVLWIHGPQAVLLEPTAALRQRMERRRNGPSIHSYAAVGGENRLLADLADLAGVQAIPRLGAPSGELTALLARLSGGERIVAVRERLEQTARPEGVETSDHLARLWAREEIDRQVRRWPGEPASAFHRKEAVALASRYHLVTAVSGAVVLEQASQYREAGLEPGDASNVPTVPEPGTWALLALVAAVLLWVVRGRRRFPDMGHAA
jgi:hypothetical protein